MKALTLTQPWATLVAIGAKRIETRGWKTGYRGPLAIHAAKGDKPESLAAFALTRLLIDFTGRQRLVDLPRAAVVAVCDLVDCVPITSRLEQINRGGRVWKIDYQEIACGDYTPGRYAWLLADVQPFVVPMSARGALGLWDWNKA